MGDGDTFDVLRIIATDSRGLKPSERDFIKSAADELEQVYKHLIATQAALIESQGHRIALNEVLAGYKKTDPEPLPAIKSGWMTVTHNWPVVK